MGHEIHSKNLHVNLHVNAPVIEIKKFIVSFKWHFIDHGQNTSLRCKHIKYNWSQVNHVKITGTRGC